ncbi:hypothetical protein [Petrotoga sp. 9PWA.NaAc.5.4]|uniref:hypothetical protein n=1 Tax=Petrotoga sp. 9PWA.NaAc.5.4 TaxID=1434328 RepID=UPI000CC3AEFF|nr:hypothetical protein [Petrotoga sp. 9PWA.NaAc.5.4]PNR92862.1 hypothetical protein X924_08805 [Petrotoga sp. 9PWA.NaAc.5.4]
MNDKFSNSFNDLKEKLEKIESKLDEYLNSNDFENFSKSLEFRFSLLKEIEVYKENPETQNIVQDILKKDLEREKRIKEQFEKIKIQQLNLQKSKNAMKTGYLKVEENMSRHKINKSG